MNHPWPATTPSQPPAGQPAPAADHAAETPAEQAERVARQCRMLRELAEIGMELARRVLQQTPAQPAAPPPAPQPAPAPDPGLTFGRIARAVRLTLVLEAKFAEGTLFPQKPAATHASSSIAALQQHRQRQKQQVKRLVELAIDSDPDAGDPESLLLDLNERLTDDDTTAAFVHLTVGEIVTCICRDLGITPDLRCWTDAELDSPEAQPPPTRQTHAGLPLHQYDFAPEASLDDDPPPVPPPRTQV